MVPRKGPQSPFAQNSRSQSHPFFTVFLCLSPDEGPTLHLDFSYYSYEYEVDPYASEGDAFEQTTATQAREGSLGLL